jgi:hemolysin D
MSRLEKFRRTFSAVWSLWKDRAKLSDKRLPTDLKSFLPPSLEVMEKPPHPAPRIILAIVTGLIIFGLVWAIVGKVDIITVAEGKIIPSGKIKEIQPFDRGLVSRILVSEGQLVQAGAPLIELDRTQTLADEIRLEAEGRYADEKKRRRTIMVTLLRLPDEEVPSDEEIRNFSGLEGDRENGQQLLEEYRTVAAQWKTLESQLEERKAEWASSQEIIKQLTQTLPLIEQRLEAYKKLF